MMVLLARDVTFSDSIGMECRSVCVVEAVAMSYHDKLKTKD